MFCKVSLYSIKTVATVLSSLDWNCSLQHDTVGKFRLLIFVLSCLLVFIIRKCLKYTQSDMDIPLGRVTPSVVACELYIFIKVSNVQNAMLLSIYSCIMCQILFSGNGICLYRTISDDKQMTFLIL